MYVVVFLVDAKKHIVVPQQFIFGLSQQSLLNYGKSKQKYLVFYSKEVCDNGLATNVCVAPNFALNVSSHYPCAKNETCFIGQIKYFYESFGDAKNYAEKFRAVQPVPYGRNGLEERQPPIVPRAILEQEAENSDSQATTDIDDISDDEGNHNEAIEKSGSIFQDNQIIDFDGFAENDNRETYYDEHEFLYVPLDEGNDNENHVVDILPDFKDPLETVVLEPAEIAAFDTIFNEANEKSQQIEEANETSQHLVNDNLTVSPGGTKRVTKLLDDECEMTFECESGAFTPQEVGIQTKLNDLLSGNLPYEENANAKDREYLIGNGLKITLSTKAIQGLMVLNEPGRREKETKNKSFIKALLISVCSLKTIQGLEAHEKLQKEMVNFIKDNADPNRYLEFNSLVQNALDEIKENNFK